MIHHIDHLVLTVKDLGKTCHFYTHVLGMEEVSFGNGRKALAFGNQKINLHEVGKEFEPKAAQPTSGSADLCFIASWPLTKVINHLQKCRVEIIEGPVKRTGAVGPIESVYIRDPDENLIEISSYEVLEERD
ncbi:VOC family protein [Aneurinibacillus uraniidurans]|uniref:VOC family protein n=1 Tax=Aneurinibacillus uraniidurans TaxID=2966586 RepID=UPI002349A70B|nr:VOC family protein [Aneurinibacillus sp. B1]WCN39180.1 VOC family protein [Aneurinibacillus sp. B1]